MALLQNYTQSRIHEQAILTAASDKEFTFRFLQRHDHELGFPMVLSQLTKGCEYEKELFEERFDNMYPSQASLYKIIVVIDNKNGKIIGAGSLILEHKFIRDAGIVR